MHPHEVVMREVQRDSSPKVLDLLTEGVSQPREPPHGHTHGQVLPFNQACRDMGLVRVADDHGTLGADHVRRAIPAAPDWLCLVKFYYLAVIDACPECPLGSLYIGRQCITR